MFDVIRRLKRILRPILEPVRAWARMEPGAAFDLWSATYDDQVTNPMLLLDDQLTERLLAEVPLEDKVVVDVGCGSGRRWPQLLARRLKRLIGFDASAGMLARLKAKHRDADARLVTDHRLGGIADESCDLVISTLTLGYIADAEGAFREWARVLKPGGDVVLTDLHPEAAKPGTRNFRHGGRTIAIRHHARSLTAIAAAASGSGLQMKQLEIGLVDKSTVPAYEAAGAMALYREQEGAPLMFGMHLKKGV